MALTYGFYNSSGGDRKYNSEQISAVFNFLITEGVLSSYGDHFAVVPGQGRQVIVQSGWAWFDSTWTQNDSDLPFAIEPPDISVSRIDAVVIETNHNLDKRRNTIKIVQGTPSSNPQKPPLAETTAMSEHAIAYVTVQPSATSISLTDIEIVVGKDECPFCTSILQSTSIEVLFNQWEGEFDAWFEHIQTVLSEEVVTNLYAEIDKCVKKADKATEAEAKAGTNDTHWMTPAKVKSAVESRVNKQFAHSFLGEYKGDPTNASNKTFIYKFIPTDDFMYGTVGGSGSSSTSSYTTIAICDKYGRIYLYALRIAAVSSYTIPNIIVARSNVIIVKYNSWWLVKGEYDDRGILRIQNKSISLVGSISSTAIYDFYIDRYICYSSYSGTNYYNNTPRIYDMNTSDEVFASNKPSTCIMTGFILSGYFYTIYYGANTIPSTNSNNTYLIYRAFISSSTSWSSTTSFSFYGRIDPIMSYQTSSYHYIYSMNGNSKVQYIRISSSGGAYVSDVLGDDSIYIKHIINNQFGVGVKFSSLLICSLPDLSIIKEISFDPVSNKTLKICWVYGESVLLNTGIMYNVVKDEMSFVPNSYLADENSYFNNHCILFFENGNSYDTWVTYESGLRSHLSV